MLFKCKSENGFIGSKVIKLKMRDQKEKLLSRIAGLEIKQIK